MSSPRLYVRPLALRAAPRGGGERLGAALRRSFPAGRGGRVLHVDHRTVGHRDVAAALPGLARPEPARAHRRAAFAHAHQRRSVLGVDVGLVGGVEVATDDDARRRDRLADLADAVGDIAVPLAAQVLLRAFERTGGELPREVVGGGIDAQLRHRAGWTAGLRGRDLPCAGLALRKLGGLRWEDGHQQKGANKHRRRPREGGDPASSVRTTLGPGLRRDDDRQRAVPKRAHQVTIRSTNALTGTAASLSGSSATSRIAACCLGGNRRDRLVLNFSTSTGMPSARRRLCPIGYSTTTSLVREPSRNAIVMPLAIERFAGSR